MAEPRSTSDQSDAPHPGDPGSTVHTHGQPLSKSLEALLSEEQAGDAVLTLNQIFIRTEGRGMYLVMVLLSLPFLIPVSIPGVSTLFGLVIAWLALRMAMDLPAGLPRWLGDRPLPHAFQHRVLASSRRVVLWIERISRPRRTAWLTWRAARIGNGLLLAVMALMLALPVPPIVPFTNTLPGVAILLLAVSIMEEDGVLVWLGYLAGGLAIGYFWLVADLIWRGLARFLAFAL